MISSLLILKNGCRVYLQPFIVFENPAPGVGFKRAFSGEDDIKTPFDIMKLRSANCNHK